MSRRQFFALTGLTVLLVLTAVSCEEWCRDNDFILDTECPPPVEPPPGPPIILEPDTGGTMGWKIDGGDASGGGDILGSCELRYDMLGIGIIDFNVYEAGSSTPLSAKHVVILNDDFRIEIIRSYLNTFVWEVHDKRAGSIELPCLNVVPVAAVGDEIPNEFINVLTTEGTITEEHHGVTVEKLELRVKLPVP